MTFGKELYNQLPVNDCQLDESHKTQEITALVDLGQLKFWQSARTAEKGREPENRTRRSSDSRRVKPGTTGLESGCSTQRALRLRESRR